MIKLLKSPIFHSIFQWTIYAASKINRWETFEQVTPFPHILRNM